MGIWADLGCQRPGSEDEDEVGGVGVVSEGDVLHPWLQGTEEPQKSFA